jgi:hypothetical protein
MLCSNSSCIQCKQGYSISGTKCAKKEIKHVSEQPSANTSSVSQNPKEENNILEEENEEQTIQSVKEGCVLEIANLDKCTLCDNGFYLTSSFACEKCPEGCKLCRNPRLCLRCEDNYSIEFRQGELSCLKKVKRNYFKLIKRK